MKKKRETAKQDYSDRPVTANDDYRNLLPVVISFFPRPDYNAIHHFITIFENDDFSPVYLINSNKHNK